MKVIILGTGSVSTTLVESLVAEQADVTVVDTDKDRLAELRNHHDIQTVEGIGSYPDVLRRAGADDCDLLIAASDSDEINMISCQVAFSLFRVSRRLARIRNSAYLRENKRLFREGHLPIDVVINPENVATDHISHLIKHPGATQAVGFAENRVQFLEFVVHSGDWWDGRVIGDLAVELKKINTRVVAVYRNDQPVKVTEDLVFEVGDSFCLVVSSAQADSLLEEISRLSKRCRRIMIAGGGNIGERLARTLEKDYLIRLVEPSVARCHQLADSLGKTVVLCGSATNSTLLEDERIELVDVFCALTNNDEINAMSSFLAKQKGAGKTIALINKPEYFDMLMHSDAIDIVFSPRKTTIGMFLSHARHGGIVQVHSPQCSSSAEVIEVQANGDSESSKIVGRSVNAVAWPESIKVCALAQKKKLSLMPASDIIESGDHLILFVADKKHIRALKQLVQISALSF